MKTMKSYRMDDTILGMMDAIRKNSVLKTDTEIIEFAIMNLYYHDFPEKAAGTIFDPDVFKATEALRAEVLRDKSQDQY